MPDVMLSLFPLLITFLLVCSDQELPSHMLCLGALPELPLAPVFLHWGLLDIPTPLPRGKSSCQTLLPASTRPKGQSSLGVNPRCHLSSSSSLSGRGSTGTSQSSGCLGK